MRKGPENAPGDEPVTQDRRPPDAESGALALQSAFESFSNQRYQVRRLLGQGGQKVVYLAHDGVLDRPVVVAVLRHQLPGETARRRLDQEARILAKLGDHRNIVSVHDFGEEQGHAFIVSQFVEGGSLAELMERAERRRLPINQVLKLGAEICLALEHAHALRIVHRDIKPSNVWLDKEGAAMLGDFGLATGVDFSAITAEGVVVGTPVYMPPEAFAGAPLEARSDLYSLGATLYEMVTGQPPFLGDKLVGIVFQHLNTPPVAPSWFNPETPPALERVILALLNKVPEDRPQTAKAVRDILLSIESSEPLKAERFPQERTKPLERLAEGIYVGREQEMKTLFAALEVAISGRGGLVLISGEPGSGKTRIAEQLATHARLRRAQVLLGRCHEADGAPSYWPWVQVIRAFIRQEDPQEVVAAARSSALFIAQVVPELGELVPDLRTPPELPPAEARFRFFDSIVTFLRNAAGNKPLAIVLDDLHWADAPSLLLLQFVVRELQDARVLIVGTYRDSDRERGVPLQRALGELSRQELSGRVELRGLSRNDVAEFFRMTTGLEPRPALVDEVYRQTDGNPFFLKEIVQLLVAEGYLDRPEEISSIPHIPQGVRDVIGRRAAALSGPCGDMLRVASVIGREFGQEILETVTGFSTDPLLAALDEAVAARIIAGLPPAPGQYRFAHALIRETFYEQLGIGDRVRLHRRTGEALEKLYGASGDPHLAQLALHFFKASPSGTVDKAIHYALRAAERAQETLAYEDAAGHYELALQALAAKAGATVEERARILLSLGIAHTRAGNARRARETYQELAALGRELAKPEYLAEAALGLGARLIGITAGVVDDLHISLLEEALRALPETDSSQRARLLAHLSVALYYSRFRKRRINLSTQATEMARRIKDNESLVVALNAQWFALAGTEQTEERLAVGTEIVRVAERAGDKAMTLRGHYRRHLQLMELGDRPGADAEMETYARLARELRQPIYLWQVPFCQANRALLNGRFEDSERLAKESLGIGMKAQDEVAELFFKVHLFHLRMVQGRLSELEPVVKSIVDQYPAIPTWRCGLARLYAQAGRREEAARELHDLTANDCEVLPRDGTWVISLTLLADVCVFLEDSERAGLLYRFLLPFSRRSGLLAATCVCSGAVSRFLGSLAATESRWVDAEAHFRHALQFNGRLAAPPLVAETQCHYGKMLLAQGEGSRRSDALSMLRLSFSTAEELGMRAIHEGARVALQVYSPSSG